MIEVRPYNSELKNNWNEFLKNSDNGNFLFDRNFMEYHSDRFTDASVLLFDENILVGIFPANKKENTVYSHQGLTYGGLVLQERKNPRKLINYLYNIIAYYKQNGIIEMVYKPFPNYLSKSTNDLEHFVLNMLGAEVLRVDTAFVVDLKKELKFQERRRRSIKKGEKAATQVAIDNDFDKYWNEILVPNLRDKFDSKPVHSLEEIKLLHSRFPEQIKQANAYVNGEICAGVTLFEQGDAIHCQYISSNDFGRDSGAIDYLFNHLFNLYLPNKLNFSLGTANNNGNDINFGLTEWKEGWGGKIHAHFYYKFKTENIKNLDSYIYKNAEN